MQYLYFQEGRFMEVRTVLLRKDGVKMVIIPKNSQINGGEQVLVTNNLRLINKFLEEEENGR